MRYLVLLSALLVCPGLLWAQGAPSSEYRGLARIPIVIRQQASVGQEYNFQVRKQEFIAETLIGEQVVYYTQKLLEKHADGRKRYSIRYRRFIVHQKAPLVINYDSQKDPPGEHTAIHAAMVGATICFEVDRTGKPFAFAGFDAILRQVRKKLGPEKARLLQEQFNGLLDSMRQSYTPLPQRKLRPGTCWEQHVRTMAPIIGSFGQTLRYWYLGVGRRQGVRCAKIYIDGRIETIQRRALKDNPALSFSLSDGKIKGGLYLDLYDGTPISSHLNVQMRLTLSQMGRTDSKMRRIIIDMHRLSNY